MVTKLQLKLGTAADWSAQNPILIVGEPGFETDTRKIKIGDGTTAWNDLDYLPVSIDDILGAGAKGKQLLAAVTNGDVLSALGIQDLTIRGVNVPDWRSSITGLTGGTATDLDSIATIGLDVNYLIALVISGVPHWYVLKAGTTAENPPSVIRPDDYAPTTNEKIWIRIL